MTGRPAEIPAETYARAVVLHDAGKGSWREIAVELGLPGSAGSTLKRHGRKFRPGGKSPPGAPGLVQGAEDASTAVRPPSGAVLELPVGPSLFDLIAEVRDLSDRLRRLEQAEALRRELDAIPPGEVLFAGMPGFEADEGDGSAPAREGASSEPADPRPVDPPDPSNHEP